MAPSAMKRAAGKGRVGSCHGRRRWPRRGMARATAERAARRTISTDLRRDFSDTPARLSRLCGRRRCEAGKSTSFVDREGHQDTIKQGLRWISPSVEGSGSGRPTVRTVDTWLGCQSAGFLLADYRPVVAKALSRISSAVSQDVRACHVLVNSPVSWWRPGLVGLAVTTGERLHDRASLCLPSRLDHESRSIRSTTVSRRRRTFAHAAGN